MKQSRTPSQMRSLMQSLEPRLLLCSDHATALSPSLVYSTDLHGWIRQRDINRSNPKVVDRRTPAPMDARLTVEANKLPTRVLGSTLGSTLGTGGNPVANAAPTAYTTGEKDILMIRVRFNDQGSTYEPQSLGSMQTVLSELDTFFRKNSFGATWLDLTPDVADPQASTVTPVYTLPGTQAEYNSWNEFRLLNDAIAVAANPSAYPGNTGLAAYSTSTFNQYAVRYNGGPGGFSGQAYVGSTGTWLKNGSTGVAAHEFGHNFGLWHANYWDPTSDITAIGAGANNEYGDPWDTMGPARAGNNAFNAYNKDRLGWLNNQTVTATTDGVYRVSAHDLGGSLTTGANYAIVVNRDTTHTYWVGFRQSLTNTTSLLNAVELHWYNTENGKSDGQFIDTLPLTSTREDGTIQIGRTFTDPVSKISFTPIAKGTTGSLPWMDVKITLADAPANNAPDVSVNASTISANLNQAINFSSIASDPNGDSLNYFWQFGDGTYSTTNTASVSKSFSQSGEYRVRLVVSDAKGGQTSDSLIVKINNATVNKYTGRVLDNLGQPIAGALINNGLATNNASYRWTYTDTDGFYTLTNVTAGSYTMTANYPGVVLAASGFTNPISTASDVQNVNFNAGPELTYKISGTVTDSTGAVLSGVLVSNGIESELTSATGTYSLSNTPAGIYTVTATKVGYAFPSVQVSVDYGDKTAVNFQQPNVYVNGEITGITSSSGVSVTDGTRTGTVYTSGQGASARVYYYMYVPYGTWNIRVLKSAASFSPVGFSNPVALPATGSVTLNFAKDAATDYSVSGSVSRKSLPFAGATVSVTNGTTTFQTQSDTVGNYYLDNLTNGSWTVSAASPGVSFTPASSAFTISNASQVNKNFTSDPINPPPTVAIAAQATQSTPTKADLYVLGADDEGEASLTYVWSTVTVPSGSTTTFSNNSNSSANSTVVTFNRPGTYLLRVTIADLQGAIVTSDVSYTINSVATSITLSPTTVTVPLGSSQQFTASMRDQFNLVMSPQPTFTWSASEGSITTSGFYTASTYGAITITASAGVISGTATANTSYPVGPGTGILRELWTGLNGSDLTTLNAAIAAGTLPNSTQTLSTFETPINSGDSYGQRLRGYFIAPATGAYTFWIASDDYSQLYLSTDNTSANKQLIASVVGNTTSRQWTKYASQQSASINLVAGQRYYIEALHKEGTGGDNLAVRVQLPGGLIEEPIAGHRLDPFVDAPPTVNIQPITPNPRTTPVNAVTITFSEAISGFDAADLVLTRNSQQIVLSGISINTTDNITYVVSGLSSLTPLAGQYVLTLAATGSGIVDVDSNALATGDAELWQTYSTVAGRHIFYNNSAFDGNNAAANVADDGAIATDKSALISGTATFSNYTSYSKGINGVMVDIANPGGTITANDFIFKVGNSSQTSNWTVLQAMPTVTVRPGAGVNGSDRVTLIWPDGTVTKNWLQVTVLSTPATGLQTSDRFYFGNAIGDTGDSTVNANVNSADMSRVVASYSGFSLVNIYSLFDINRDGRVNSADMSAVVASYTGFTPLQLILV